MKKIADNMWTVDRPFRFFIANLGVRMTIIKLNSGGLMLHSPVSYEDDIRKQLDSMGDVCAIVAPNWMHNLFLCDWINAYPNATYYKPPGMPKIKISPIKEENLGDDAPSAWQGEFEQHMVKGMPQYNEVVFCHKASRTLILTDLAFNIHSASSASEKLFLRLNGAYRRFGPTRIFKTFIKDRNAFKASIDHILQWDFDSIILSHGEIVCRGGKDQFREAFEWLYSAAKNDL
jgi:hypothetical protein